MLGEKIVEESNSAGFFPEYPINSWPIFQGLFETFYMALDDLCEFNAPNVKAIGVGRHVKDILRTLKRYLSRVGLITWSPEQLQDWFKIQEKKRDGKNLKKDTREKFQYNKKKKTQTEPEPVREASGVKPQIKLSQTQDRVPTGLQPTNVGVRPSGQKVKETNKTSSPSNLPFICGSCRKHYKNVRSYRTHLYQVHRKVVPEGSSHDLKGKPFSKVSGGIKIKPSAGNDQPKQPVQVPPQNLSRPDQEIEEKIPVSKDQSRKTHTGSNTGPPEKPSQGKIRRGK